MSITKSFTATAMATLVDEGRVDWDTAVRHYMPAFKLYDSVATEHVTARDLLSHVTGVPGYGQMWPSRDISRERMFELLRYLEPNADIRTRYQYSNLMYMAAGHMIGVMSGSTWEEVVRHKLFLPLGMTASGFSLAGADSSIRALPYLMRDGEVVPVSPLPEVPSMAPCGGIVSTISDIARWLLLNLNQGRFEGRELVSGEQMRQLHSPQFLYRSAGKCSELRSIGYGLGWNIDEYRGHRLIDHAGGVTGFSAQAFFMPDARAGVGVVCNFDAGWLPARSIALNAIDRLLDVDQLPWYERTKREVEEPPQTSLPTKAPEERRIEGARPSHPLAHYAGEYEHLAFGNVKIEYTDDRLHGRFNTRPFELEHHHFDVFILRGSYEDELSGGYYVQFGVNVFGDVDTLSIPFEPEARPIVFERVLSNMRDRSTLAELAGSYAIDGAGTVTVGTGHDGKLWGTIPALGGLRYELRPVGDLEFVVEGTDPASFGLAFRRTNSQSVDEVVVRGGGEARVGRKI
jgi:hypothetical protein